MNMQILSAVKSFGGRKSQQNWADFPCPLFSFWRRSFLESNWWNTQTTTEIRVL